MTPQIRRPPLLPRAEPAANARIPAVLLPVRLEARFGGTKVRPVLRVRIYPDQLAIDSHEPELTDSEIRAGRAYWQTLWAAGKADEVTAGGAWRGLVEALGATRAAYVAQAAGIVPANLVDQPADAAAAAAPGVPPPAFADVPDKMTRPTSPSRPAVARLLPRRFTVVLFRGEIEVRRATGAQVPADLPVGPNPAVAPAPGPDELPIDDGMRWLVDFDAAVEVGMALRIPISTDDVVRGFTRMVVYGLRAASAQFSGRAALARLVEAQRFTRGLSLLPQGSPTNNTEGHPAFKGADADADRSLAAERGAALAQRDGDALAQGLALPPGTLEHIEHSDRRDQERARAMLAALWPATFGYFLRNLASELVDRKEEEVARRWILDRVRPRGPVPALRVGEQPYGVLPIAAMGFWPADHGGMRGEVMAILKKLWPRWRQAASKVPRIQRSGDPEAQIVGVLGMDASSRSYRFRFAIGDEFLGDYNSWFEIDGATAVAWSQTKANRTVLDELGFTSWNPRFARLAMNGDVRTMHVPLVTAAPLSEELPLGTPPKFGKNYIRYLREGSARTIRDVHLATILPLTRPLLHNLLRQSMLAQYAHDALTLLVDRQLASPASLVERERVKWSTDAATSRAGPAVMTAWDALEHDMPDADMRVADWLHLQAPRTDVRYRPLWDVRDSLAVLEDAPTAELERLLTETLDTFSHRLDPWLSAVAWDLVLERRARGETETHVGAFGWLEDLRADPQPPVVLGVEAERVQRMDARIRERVAPGQAIELKAVRQPYADDGGFIHAPSIGQASTAAILRNGHLTHRHDADGALLALNLSSRRVRVALRLLDGVREGQPLAALLGYELERGLHRAHLDIAIQPIRDRHPLVANKLTQPTGPTEAVAASNVVDGLKLHAAWKANTFSFAGLGLDNAQIDTLKDLLRQVDDALDAVADLSLAESVFQLTRGNYARAGGLMDAISRGERPPEPEVVITPRGGLDMTHRLLLVFSGPPALAAGWLGAAHPRVVAEPWLNAWLSTLLPVPPRVRCAVRAGLVETTVRLDALELAPADVLALTGALRQVRGSELEARIRLRAAPDLVAAGADPAVPVDVHYERDATWAPSDVTFPELLVVADALRRVLGDARPLKPADLRAPDGPGVPPPGTTDYVELAARGQTLIDLVADARQALDDAATEGTRRAALLAASLFGAPGAVPVPGESEDDTARRVASVRAELHRRHTEATGAVAGFVAADATEKALSDHLVGLIRSVVGRDAVVLSRLDDPQAGAFATQLGDTASLLGGEEDAPVRWLLGLTRVRPRVARWDHALAVTSMLAAAPQPMPRPLLAQLPPESPDRWLGLPLDPTQPPVPGRVALAVWATVAPADGVPLGGLLLDEWPEQVTGTEETTGVAFHFDQPSARAPQSLLLAACPDDRSEWDDELILATILQALEMAYVRTVDLDAGPGFAGMLPALYVPFNPDGDTVGFSTSWIR